MSTAARKARKKANIPFFRALKTVTPVLERTWFHEQILPPARVSKAFRDLLPRRRVVGQRIRKAFDMGWLPADNKAAAQVAL